MALIRLLPAFKGYLWGGTKSGESYNKKAGLDIMAESWELSTHKNGQSIVDSREYKGSVLSEYVGRLGKDALGTKGDAFELFPILIKFIDARGSLSIWVHPDDKYALRAGKEYGKAEMQYILDVEEGASLYYGTNKEITKGKFRACIEGNTVLDVLKEVSAHKGDVLFTESGTTHTVGEGVVICETQWNSNTTYHVYDFGRVGKDGKLGELYIKKTIDVSNLTPLESDSRPIGGEKDCGIYKCATITACEYFTTYMYDMRTEYDMKVGKESFASFVIADGEGSIESNDTILSIHEGDSVFASANMGKVIIRGSCRFILSRI